jgi:hypothetical protein
MQNPVTLSKSTSREPGNNYYDFFIGAKEYTLLRDHNFASSFLAKAVVG